MPVDAEHARAEAIRAEVRARYPTLAAIPLQELAADTDRDLRALAPSIDSGRPVAQLEQLRALVCGHQQSLLHIADTLDLASAIALLILAPSVGLAIPIEVGVRIAVYIARDGVAVYCEGWN
ncbi:MAG: hypothetical protein JO023_11820 [Chloroflexi bacterium]|nr:hypothetical protein [Chloroflexota bacterium]